MIYFEFLQQIWFSIKDYISIHIVNDFELLHQANKKILSWMILFKGLYDFAIY